ncbi:Cu(I)-responsive transcriptional regulator [Actinobacillus equuli subsp. haemolyticus]|uniref:Heavy metal-dependent transcriptional regulator n=1 Tax=Actinobacillus equuli TaxID=718 RepID=A0AAX3FLF1_ACTEU|nr:Cu(I)-responsive transcriptional regulator [Actinobacillus equuli]AIZ78261.1 transcriptional regulator [Actinobacillus equuli subsp. equuli]WGE42343.1 Cu(I)-responsive transcriptional regulator [Actinobacillus equuli subsp. haemolyticus]WGE44534.1 Cu(I)-responsive transcriptional regulator [Actinobacillus equuli subsp. equuli]WGE53063.1 Cu(I)-responsive transcriptional regulator [Actinobacillus equuli subsp. haemolyticus]WGE63320.1 Cu(I)-responsive transcriptional regulator [Actinobacillus 
MNISQAAEHSGLSAKQIRDYEKAGLLPQAARSSSGYRVYSAADLERLHFISNARKVGFSLVQISELLKLNDDPHRTSREVKQLTEQHIEELQQKIADLQQMLSLLKSWSKSCCGNDSPECSILSGLKR